MEWNSYKILIILNLVTVSFHFYSAFATPDEGEKYWAIKLPFLAVRSALQLVFCFAEMSVFWLPVGVSCNSNMLHVNAVVYNLTWRFSININAKWPPSLQTARNFSWSVTFRLKKIWNYRYFCSDLGNESRVNREKVIRQINSSVIK